LLVVVGILEIEFKLQRVKIWQRFEELLFIIANFVYFSKVQSEQVSRAHEGFEVVSIIPIILIPPW